MRESPAQQSPESAFARTTGEGVDAAVLLRALESVPCAVALLDAALRYRWVNELYARLLGRPADDFPGLGLRDVLGATVFARAQPYLERALAGVAQQFELDSNAPGRLRDVHVAYTPHVVGGAVTGVIAVIADVAERVAARRAAREGDALFRAICESAPLGIALLQPGGGLEYANPALLRIAGRGMEEIAGSGWREAVHPDDRDRVAAGWADVVASVGSYAVAGRMLHRDGRVVWWEAATAPVRDGDRLLGHVGTIVDVTARVRAERELESQRALAVRAERSRLLGDLASGVAHEINQPLTGVRGLAEHTLVALGRGWSLPDEELSSRLRRIVEQADRISAIVDHVRMFARESSRDHLDPVDLSAVVERALDLLRAQLASRGIGVRLELAAGLPPVIGNFAALEEAVVNLVTNARDAIEELAAGVSSLETAGIVIRTAHDAATGRVSLAVQDRGTGMTDAVRARAFDAFFTTKGVDRGTGLGLAIVRSTVERFGGAIAVDTRPGAGSTMTLSFPVAGPRGERSE